MKQKKILKKFKVVKFKTREYITKSFMVCFHDSSAILDAFYLNKNVLSIQSKHLSIFTLIEIISIINISQFLQLILIMRLKFQKAK